MASVPDFRDVCILVAHGRYRERGFPCFFPAEGTETSEFAVHDESFPVVMEREKARSFIQENGGIFSVHGRKTCRQPRRPGLPEGSKQAPSHAFARKGRDRATAGSGVSLTWPNPRVSPPGISCDASVHFVWKPESTLACRSLEYGHEVPASADALRQFSCLPGTDSWRKPSSTGNAFLHGRMRYAVAKLKKAEPDTRKSPPAFSGGKVCSTARGTLPGRIEKSPGGLPASGAECLIPTQWCPRASA